MRQYSPAACHISLPDPEKNIDPDKWNSYVEVLIEDIRRKSRWMNVDVLAKIYITEKWWKRLLDLVGGTKHLPYIQHYEQYLAADYSEELAGLYEKGIIDYFKVNTGRKHYQQACRYLERMLKLAGRTRVRNLVADFRREYPQRRALLDEPDRF